MNVQHRISTLQTLLQRVRVRAALPRVLARSGVSTDGAIAIDERAPVAKRAPVDEVADVTEIGMRPLLGVTPSAAKEPESLEALPPLPVEPRVEAPPALHLDSRSSEPVLEVVAEEEISGDIADLGDEDELAAAPISSRRPVSVAPRSSESEELERPVTAPPESGRQFAAEQLPEYEADMTGVRARPDSLPAAPQAPPTLVELSEPLTVEDPTRRTAVTRVDVAQVAVATMPTRAREFLPVTFGELLDATLAL